jgi:DMSO/TMAO reductase YedYZ molybdopterin-dependent catalytic subunit
MTAESENSAPRTPPGQHVVDSWPVLDLGIVPRVDQGNWRLAVDGLVHTPVDWSWDDLMAQPQVHLRSDIHCVTTWSRYENHWDGVALRHLLSVVRPRAEARFVLAHSSDGYSTNLPLAVLDDDDVLLATGWEGAPLTRDHGGPVRLVVPKKYFWKSAKWIRRLEFLEADHPGYWETRGYHREGDPWREERYAD